MFPQFSACYSLWNSDNSPPVWLWATLKDSTSSSSPLIQQIEDEHRNFDTAIVPPTCYSQPQTCFAWRWSTKVRSHDLQLAAMKCGQSGPTAFLVYTPLPCAIEPMDFRWKKKTSQALCLCSSDVIWKTCCFIPVLTVYVLRNQKSRSICWSVPDSQRV